MNLEKLESNLANPRHTASMAQSVVIKLKEMGLPEHLDDDLGTLSTDLGDLCNAQDELTSLVNNLTEASQDWDSIGDIMVDIRAVVEHINWHASSLRRPINKLTHYAYRTAL